MGAQQYCGLHFGREPWQGILGLTGSGRYLSRTHCLRKVRLEGKHSDTTLLATLIWSGVHLYASESARHHCHYSAAMSSMTPTGIDQLVNLMTNMGFDASDMSLTEAQQMVATARAATQGSLPASSSQGPQPTTIETLPEAVPISQVMDQDDIPLTLLQQPN
eukprot:1302472-Amphidinium_carterae.1